jgi:drug/metabolite transporter (DMT)-like permease
MNIVEDCVFHTNKYYNLEGLMYSTKDGIAGGLLVISRKALGVLFGVSAGAMWAVETVLGKMLFSSFTFIQVTASEVFFAALTAFAYIIARRESMRISRKNIGSSLIIGLVGTVFAPLMYFLGLTQTLAVNATLIAHLQPLFVTILGLLLLKEKLHRRDLAASVLIIFAVIFITGRTAENLANLRLGSLGDLVVLLATFSWAIVAIPGKQLTKEVNSAVIVGHRFLIASMAFIPILLYSNQLIVNSAYQVLLGIVVGLGYIFYYEGLKRVKASQVALAELSSPFFAAILAWNFLGEETAPMQVMGAILLMLGLYILTREKSDIL